MITGVPSILIFQLVTFLALVACLFELHRKLGEILTRLNDLTERENMNMQDLVTKVTNLTSVTEGVKTVTDAIIAQDQKIAADLKAALASQDPVALQAVADALDANIAQLEAARVKVADAVAANTPAA